MANRQPELGLQHYVVHYERDNVDKRQQPPREGVFDCWSTIVEFENPISAFSKMVTQCPETMWAGVPIPDEKRPAVMTAFVGSTRRTVILSSTMKKLGGSIAPAEYTQSKPLLNAIVERDEAPREHTILELVVNSYVSTLDVWTRWLGRNLQCR